MLKNSRFASSPTTKTPPKEKTSYSDDDIKAELLRAADEANQFLEARSKFSLNSQQRKYWISTITFE
jgi:hypothetical protein